MHKPKRDPFRVVVDDECRHNSEEKTVVDERCFCGHLKSEHFTECNRCSNIVDCDGPGWDECMDVEATNCKQCPCVKFTWFGWVFSDGSET